MPKLDDAHDEPITGSHPHGPPIRPATLIFYHGHRPADANQATGGALRWFSAGRVLSALASDLEDLGGLGLLRVANGHVAAEQFAYLVVGPPLDRAVMVGAIPAEEQLIACAQEGVETFLARYGVG